MNDLILRLAALARRGHTYCEDGWYSCPKAEDGCYNESRGPECDCGADERNAEVDSIMAQLSQPNTNQQENHHVSRLPQDQ